MKEPLVINLIGGPGSGKSTLAAGIFYLLKCLGLNCEMSLEFAKDKVYEESIRTMDDQIYIFGKQFHKLWRLKDKVDVIITDSPLPISLYYNKDESHYFNDFVVEQYNKFNNLMFFIKRSGDYHPEGRLQTEEESKAIDDELKALMQQFCIEYEEVEQDEALEYIVSIVKKNIEIAKYHADSRDYIDLFNNEFGKDNPRWNVWETILDKSIILTSANDRKYMCYITFPNTYLNNKWTTSIEYSNVYIDDKKKFNREFDSCQDVIAYLNDFDIEKEYWNNGETPKIDGDYILKMLNSLRKWSVLTIKNDDYYDLYDEDMIHYVRIELPRESNYNRYRVKVMTRNEYYTTNEEAKNRFVNNFELFDDVISFLTFYNFGYTNKG